MMEESSKAIKFLGSGWSFPPVFDKISRGVEMRQGNNDIRESVEVLLSTELGERLYDPLFGCDLNELLFETFSLSLQTRISDRIHRAITEYEPRIDVESINFEEDRENNRILVDIAYTIRTTNSRTNMVFPFYISEGTNL